MNWAVAIAGVLAVAAAWWIAMQRNGDPFVVMALALGPVGVLSILLGATPLSPAVRPLVAVGAGLAGGAALYAGTVVFVRLASGIPSFAAAARGIYAKREGGSRVRDLLLGVGVVVVCEELFWRGLFQGRVGASTSLLIGALITWLVYALANAASRNVAVTTAAAVGGAVWVALAYWTHGCLASIASHMVWTTLMLVAPPVKEGARA